MTLTPDADRRSPSLTADDLFDRHRALAASIARRYSTTPHAADIRQVADIALWSAATRFDPERGVFERFAAVTISGEIKKFLRRAGWAVRVSRRRQEDTLLLRRVVDELTLTLARTPTTEDLVEATGWPTERVHDAIRCDAVRFSTPDLDDRTPATEPEDSLDLLIDRLPVPERDIVRLTYVCGLTQREVSERLTMSQSMVHRRLRRAHEALAEMFHEDAAATSTSRPRRQGSP